MVETSKVWLDLYNWLVMFQPRTGQSVRSEVTPGIDNCWQETPDVRILLECWVLNLHWKSFQNRQAQAESPPAKADIVTKLQEKIETNWLRDIDPSYGRWMELRSRPNRLKRSTKQWRSCNSAVSPTWLHIGISNRYEEVNKQRIEAQQNMPIASYSLYIRTQELNG